MKILRTGTVVCLVILLTILSIGCGSKKEEKPDLGKIEGSKYSNQYFGLQLSIPDNWQVQDNEAQKKIIDEGTEMVGKDENQKAMLESSAKQALYLLTMFKYPLGTPVKYNPGFIGVAENVKGLPGIKSGKDYLLNARNILETSKLKYTFPKNIYSEKIDNVNFDVMEVQTNFGTITIMQKYYSTIIKDYSLNFIISYTTQEELNSLNKVISSIKFGSN